MRVPSFNSSTPGFLTSKKVRELNRAYDTIERLSDPHPAPGLSISVGSAGLGFTQAPPPYFLAQITGSTLNSSGVWAHSWVTVEELNDGTKTVYDDGMAGSTSTWPGYEDNNNQTPPGSYVWMRPREGGWTEFAFGELIGDTLDTTIVTSSCPLQVYYVGHEVPSGSINSSNKVFTLTHPPIANTEDIYLLPSGGTGYVLQDNSSQYSLSSSTVTFVSAPTTGSKLRADYWTSDTSGTVAVVSHLIVESQEHRIPGGIVFPPTCMEDPATCCPGEGSGPPPVTCCGGVTLPPTACLSVSFATWAPMRGAQVPLSLVGTAFYSGSTTFAISGCASPSGNIATLKVSLYCTELGFSGDFAWVAYFELDVPGGAIGGGPGVYGGIGTGPGDLPDGIVAPVGAVMTCSPFTFLSTSPIYFFSNTPESLLCGPCTIPGSTFYGCTSDFFSVSVVSGSCSGGGGLISRSSLGIVGGNGDQTIHGVTVTAGTLLVVMVGTDDVLSGGDLSSSGFVYFAGTPVIAREVVGTGAVSCIIYSLFVSSTTTGDIQVVTGAPTAVPVLMAAVEVMGLTTGAVDKGHDATDSSGTTNPDSGATTATTVASEYAQSVTFMVGAGISGNWSGGFGNGQSTSMMSGGGTTYTLNEGFDVLTSTGTVDAVFTCGITKPSKWSAGVVTFK